MKISNYGAAEFHQVYGITMADIEGLGVGAGWGVVAPGGASDAHQHDETETFVIVAGTGVLRIDGREYPALPGTVVQFEAFETHVIRNTGDTDLLFTTFYWRDPVRAAERSLQPAARRRFGDRPTFVFSTPPTPNGDLHLGHLSGPYLGADVFVRFQRLNGAHVWHLTGSDDYQSYVVECARREGATPAETAAHYSREIAETLRMMDISVDQYTVTNAEQAYPDGLRDFFSKAVHSGGVELNTGAALFDPATGRYLYEVDVSGQCPACGSGAGGNICEECGEPNTCADLLSPAVRGSDEPPQRGYLERYSLPLHRFEAEVREHHRLGRVPARLRDLAHRLFQRPQLDIAISHPSDWGVRPDEATVPGQVIWVWPEMAYGFLYGIEALGRRLQRSWSAAEPQQDWKIVHFFGYDNSFYHAILYPVLYRLAYPDWAPDIDYNVNEFLLLEGAKFSTSRRHAIWGKEILTPDTVDAVRYFLSLTRSETRRTNYARAEFDRVLNDVLIGRWQAWLDDLGTRVRDRFGGVAPDAGTWTPEQVAFLGRLNSRLAAIAACLSPDGFSLNLAAAELDGLVTDARRFAELESRWTGLDEWEAEGRTGIALELAAAWLLARCAEPVLPRFAARLARSLGGDLGAQWPELAELVPPGSRITLAGRTFFGPGAGSDEARAEGDAVPGQVPATSEPAAGPAAAVARPAEPGAGQVLLESLVRQLLQLESEQDLAGRRLADLQASSLQAVALQYQVLEHFGVDLSLEQLLGEQTLGQLAEQLTSRPEVLEVGR